MIEKMYYCWFETKLILLCNVTLCKIKHGFNRRY